MKTRNLRNTHLTAPYTTCIDAPLSIPNPSDTVPCTVEDWTRSVSVLVKSRASTVAHVFHAIGNDGVSPEKPQYRVRAPPASGVLWRGIGAWDNRVLTILIARGSCGSPSRPHWERKHLDVPRTPHRAEGFCGPRSPIADSTRHPKTSGETPYGIKLAADEHRLYGCAACV